MAHKFATGQAVEYKPIGAKVGVFRVVKQMPDEFGAIDFRYRIKSVQETFGMRSNCVDDTTRAV
jgi:hypothetical protein